MGSLGPSKKRLRNGSDLGGVECSIRHAEPMGPVRVLQEKPATTHRHRTQEMQQHPTSQHCLGQMDNTALNFGDAFLDARILECRERAV